MSDYASKLYEHFKTEKQYTFSSDVNIKSLENLAVDELQENGYIIVKMRTIGYVIADIS